MKLVDDLTFWLREQVHQSQAEGIVVGLSGGIDSACVAALAKKSLGDKVLGLILPCESHSEDAHFAKMTAEKFALQTKKVSLDLPYKNFLEILPKGEKMALANLKPRLRMIVLYYFANNLNYLVAGTGNKSELAVGYFTKYGDGGVDLLPLGDLLKAEVRALAQELGVPEEIIARPPSAGLWEGQTDEKELGISYKELDEAILALETGKGTNNVAQPVLAKVKSLFEVSRHKGDSIPIYKKKQ